MPHVDYFHTASSPFSYLGHRAIRALAGRHGVELRARPVNLKGIWAQSGAVVPAERPKVRQDYRIIELKRIAERRGLPLNPRPRFWPVDPALADLVVCALAARGSDPLDLMDRVFSGVWARNEDIGDRTQVAAYLTDLGFDAESLIAIAESPDTAVIRQANTEAANQAGLPGVPGYVLSGEPFFGQDRIDDLEHALTTGRGPFDAT